MKLLELFEQSGKTAAVAFGRMNPPTIGHQKVVEAILKQKADAHFLFVSQTHKPTGKNKTRLENPLPFDVKLGFIQQAFPNIDIGDTSVSTAIGLLQYLEKQGFDNVVFVAGSDRVGSFTELFNNQNGVDYNLKSIKVVSSGARDPDAEGAEGMSASKMRAAAIEDDFDAFKTGLPAGLQGDAEEVFSAVRQGLEPWLNQEGVSEESNGGGSQNTQNQVYQYMIRQAPDFMKTAITADVKKAIMKAMSYGSQISVPDLASYAYGILKTNDLDESWDDIKKFGKKAAVAGAIGLGALGSGGAYAQSSGEDYLPDIVAHVKFKVDGKEIKKDINLGTTYKSPREAAAALEKFLRSKGIKYFEYELERVKPKDNDYMDNTPYSKNDAGNDSNYLDNRPTTDSKSKTGYMENKAKDVIPSNKPPNPVAKNANAGFGGGGAGGHTNPKNTIPRKEKHKGKQFEQGVAEAKSASRRWHDALQREKERRERNERAGQELLNPKKKEEPKEKDAEEAA